MLHVVDFRTAALDSGEAESAAIQPYNDGETADQTVLRRPTENNRARVDTLRSLVREHIMLKDYSDGGYILSGGGTVTPATGGGGELTFAITADLYVLPFATPGGGASVPYLASTKASLAIGALNVNQIVFTSKVTQFTGASFPVADGNKTSVEITHNAAGPTVTVEGAAGEVNNIKIEINSTVTTIAQVISAVAGHGTASALVDVAVGGTTPGGTACPLWGPTEWTEYSDRFLRGGAPGLAHVITAIGLSGFFGTAANELEKGDTLAINYDKVLNIASMGGRLQSTPENTNLNVDGALFNTRVNPEFIPNCIPVCKRVDATTLVFVDGSIIVLNQPSTLWWGSKAQYGAENGALATPLGWTTIHDGPTNNPPTTIREALTNIDDALTALEVVLTCTDGTASTGGMFNGTSALAQALFAASAGNGALILVRKGTYSITSETTITKNTFIRGVESGVVIENNATTGHALLFSGTVHSGSGIQNVSFTNGGSTSYKMVSVVDAQDFRLSNVVSAGQISVGAPRCVLAQLSLTIGNGHVGVYGGAGAVGLTLRDIDVICTPATTTVPIMAFNLGCDNLLLERVKLTVTGSSNNAAPLLTIDAPTFTVRDLYCDMNDRPIRIADADNTPFSFRGHQGVIDGVAIVNAGLIPSTTGGDGAGLNLSTGFPFFQVNAEPDGSVYGQISLKNVGISGFSTSTPSGVTKLCVVGSLGDSPGDTGTSQTVGGRLLAENISIDMSACTAPTGTNEITPFTNVQANSAFRNCQVNMGATGAAYAAWRVLDVAGVSLDDCYAVGTLAGGSFLHGYAFIANSGGATVSGCSMRNCKLLVADLSSSGGRGLLVTRVSGTLEHNVFVGNNLVAGSTPLYCVEFVAACDYNVFTGNRVSGGATGYILDTPLNNLTGVTAPFDLNVLN